jgi:hypothetical protein
MMEYYRENGRWPPHSHGTLGEWWVRIMLRCVYLLGIGFALLYCWCWLMLNLCTMIIQRSFLSTTLSSDLHTGFTNKDASGQRGSQCLWQSTIKSWRMLDSCGKSRKDRIAMFLGRHDFSSW